MVAKKVGIVPFIMFLVFCAPLFSQTITIDQSKLSQVIQQEVSKAIDKAVNEAVAVAVKDTELKYTDQLATKDKQIATLDGQIQKAAIAYNALSIDKQNLQIDFDNYKKNHGLTNDLKIGGILFLSGLVVDEGLHIWFKF